MATLSLSSSSMATSSMPRSSSMPVAPSSSSSSSSSSWSIQDCSSHCGSLLDRLRGQREQGRFCDLLLRVQGRQFHAHRCVLASCSSWFDSHLKMHKTTKEELYIECTNVETFYALLTYCYTGQIVIDGNNVSELLYLASHFSMNKLRLYCSDYLLKHVNVNNALSVFELSLQCHCADLYRQSVFIVQQHFESLMKSSSMLTLSSERVQVLISEKLVSTSLLLDTIAIWVGADLETRERCYPELLDRLVDDIKSASVLQGHVDSQPLYNRSPSSLYTLLSMVIERQQITLGPALTEVYSSLCDRYENNENDQDNSNEEMVDDVAFLSMAIKTCERDLESSIANSEWFLHNEDVGQQQQQQQQPQLLQQHQTMTEHSADGNKDAFVLEIMKVINEEESLCTDDVTNATDNVHTNNDVCGNSVLQETKRYKRFDPKFRAITEASANKGTDEINSKSTEGNSASKSNVDITAAIHDLESLDNRQPFALDNDEQESGHFGKYRKKSIHPTHLEQENQLNVEDDGQQLHPQKEHNYRHPQVIQEQNATQNPYRHHYVALPNDGQGVTEPSEQPLEHHERHLQEQQNGMRQDQAEHQQEQLESREEQQPRGLGRSEQQGVSRSQLIAQIPLHDQLILQDHDQEVGIQGQNFHDQPQQMIEQEKHGKQCRALQPNQEPIHPQEQTLLDAQRHQQESLTDLQLPTQVNNRPRMLEEPISSFLVEADIESGGRRLIELSQWPNNDQKNDASMPTYNDDESRDEMSQRPPKDDGQPSSMNSDYNPCNGDADDKASKHSNVAVDSIMSNGNTMGLLQTVDQAGSTPLPTVNPDLAATNLDSLEEHQALRLLPSISKSSVVSESSKQHPRKAKLLAEHRRFSSQVKSQSQVEALRSSECESVQKRVKCDHCSYETISPHRLRVHKRQHESKGSRSATSVSTTFKCPLCDFTTGLRREQRQHVMDSHFQDGPPFKCSSCDFTSSKLPPLIAHMRCHNRRDEELKCSNCNFVTHCHRRLKRHVASHRPHRFQCDICQRSFSTSTALKVHHISHSEEQPYKCDICGLRTKYKAHLVLHQRVHDGRAHRCDFDNCNYTTPKLSLLEAHKRTHTQSKEFVCTICCKAFVEKSQLRRHERTHSTDLPFGCHVCSFRTRRKDKLKAHLKRIHGIQPKSCEKNKRSVQDRSDSNATEISQ